MKLTIKRDQADVKGVFGGHKGMKFLLSYRVELTPEEQGLITRYKAEHHPLTFATNSKGEQIPRYNQFINARRNRRDEGHNDSAQ